VCNKLLSRKARLAIGVCHPQGRRLISFAESGRDAGELSHPGPFHSTAIEKDISKSRLIAISSCGLPSESELAANLVSRDVHSANFEEPAKGFSKIVSRVE
jgi:hypothetical protein